MQKNKVVWRNHLFVDVILKFTISEAAYALIESWDSTVFHGYKNWENAQRLVCHYGLFSRTVRLKNTTSFSATSGTLHDDLRMFYCCRRPKFATKILLCGISIWLTVTCSSAAYRMNFCVSTEKWLRERTTMLRYKYTPYLVSFTATKCSV